MIEAPANWNELWNSGARIEIRIDVCLYGSVYVSIDESNITSSGVTLQRSLYDKPSAGNAASEMLRFTIYKNDFTNLVRVGQKVRLAFRLNDGAAVTNWVNRGVFYITTLDNDERQTTVTAYDEIEKLDGCMPSIKADLTIQEYANKLSTAYGVDLLKNSPMLDETFTVVNESTQSGSQTTIVAKNFVLKADQMDGVTARDIVSSIAGMLGGNAYVDTDGILQCKSPFHNYSKSTADVMFSAGNLSKGSEEVTFNQIVVEPSKGEKFISFAGAQCTVKLEDVFLPTLGYRRLFASGLATNVFEDTDKRPRDRMYNATGAFVTPLVELFDVAQDTVTGEKFAITDYSLSISGNCTGQLSRPLPDNSASRIQGRVFWSNSIGYVNIAWKLETKVSASATFKPISKYSGLIRVPLFYGKTSIRINGVKYLTFPANYYYDSNGNVHNNVDVRVRLVNRIYDLSGTAYYMIEAIIVDFNSLDIDPSRPYSFKTINIRGSDATEPANAQIFDYNDIEWKQQ